MENKDDLILGLDVSTKTIGIALFENKGDKGKLKLLHHVSPRVKPKPETKIQELCDKARIFREEFLNDSKGVGISKVIIEEPLLRSNNVRTVGTLLKFNGMICKDVYEVLGLVPEFISSYDARKFGFPELMSIRTHNKKGEPYNEKELKRKKPVLFGGYPWDIDKKEVIWEKVADLEPHITWLRTRNKTLKQENFDMCDAYTAVIGHMNKIDIWPKE